MPIYLDADACPVKDEAYKVAKRHQVKVFVVTNNPIRVPEDPLIEMVWVRGGFDAADDWIVTQVTPSDVAVTADILLAERCLKVGARVIGPKGGEFTDDSIHDALAGRALSEMLRQGGTFTGGPAPFGKPDRSRFLSKLDEVLVALNKRRPV